MIRICLSGLGRAGMETARVIMEQKDLKLVSVIVRPGSEKAGKDLGELLGCSAVGIPVEGADRLEETVFRTRPDVVVDFSLAEAAIRNASRFSKLKVNVAMCTTGLTRTDMARLKVLTRKYGTGIACIPNVTLGVNVMMLLSQLASSLLTDYDFQITERHFAKKKDSPSGTASKIAAAVGRGLESAGRSNMSVPVHAVRAGGIVGYHELMVIGQEDQLTISHESFSRRAFAIGSLKAARFLVGRSGFFEMTDVLDLRGALLAYLDANERTSGKLHGEREKDIHMGLSIHGTACTRRTTGGIARAAMH